MLSKLNNKRTGADKNLFYKVVPILNLDDHYINRQLIGRLEMLSTMGGATD